MPDTLLADAIKRRRVADFLTSGAGGKTPDDSTDDSTDDTATDKEPADTSEEEATPAVASDSDYNPNAQSLSDYAPGGRFYQAPAMEPAVAESVIAPSTAPTFEPVTAEYVGTGKTLDQIETAPPVTTQGASGYPAAVTDQPAQPPLDTGEAPAKLTQVERGELVKMPDQLAPDVQAQVDRGELVIPTTPPAPSGVQPAPDTLTQVERAEPAPEVRRGYPPSMVPKAQPPDVMRGYPPSMVPKAAPADTSLPPSQTQQVTPTPALETVNPELAPGTHDNPYFPHNDAQVGSVGPGQWYVNPADGSMVQKPGQAPEMPKAQPPAGTLPPSLQAQAPAGPAKAVQTQEPAITDQARYYTPYDGTRNVQGIVLHSADGSSVKADLSTLGSGDPDHKVSAHYYVERDGTIHHLVNDNDVAWQTGATSGPHANINNETSIGIETEHRDGQQNWPDAQVRAEAQIAARILKERGLTINDVYGHSDVAPERKQDPVDFPWDKFRGYVAQEMGQPSGAPGQVATATTTPPQAQPVTKGKTGLYQNEKPEDFIQGPATVFATPQDLASGQDNGVGAARLGGLSTPDTAGIALPEWVLQSKFGNSPAAWRKARVDIVDQTTGKRLRVPVVDLGPGPGPQQAGVVADLTPFVNSYFGNQGGNKNLMFKFADTTGPDVNKNPQLFADEQAAIKSGFDSSTLDKGVQKIGPTPNNYQLVPATPAQQATAQQAYIQSQREAITNLPESQSQNIVGLYKRLDAPVEGVSDPLRQEVQAGIKPQIIAAMRDKFPELTNDDDAWNKAMSDVNVLDVSRDFWLKMVGGFQGYTSVLQKGVAGTDQLHVNQFLDNALPGATDDQKHALLTKLYAMPIDQRIATVQSYLPQPQAGIPSTDPQQIISALDRLSDPNFQKQQATELDNAQKDMQRNVSSDPRLVGTGMEKIVNATAQMPSFLAAYSNPVMMPLVLAQTSDAVRAQFRQQHPEWSEAELTQKSAYATLVQFFGQEAAGRMMAGGAGFVTDLIKNRVGRGIAQVIAGAGGAAGIGAGTQAVTNLIGGRPVGAGVGEAAIAGGIQGGVTGLVHGAGELRRPAETAAEVTPPLRVGEHGPPEPMEMPEPHGPPAPTEFPVRPSDVLGPQTPEETMPWYKPGPIVTRAEERTAFTPGELQQAIAEARQSGTTEQVAQALRNLYPELDWQRQRVYLQEQPYEPVETLAPLREPTPPPPSGEAQPTPPHAEKPPNALPTEPAPIEQGTDKYVSSIANRFVQPKVEAGDIGEIAPGQGYATKDLIAAGLKMSPEEVTQHMSDLMQGVGDPKAQAAAIRAEEARLSQRSTQASKIAEANPNDAQARIQADNAFNDLTDFHNGPVAKLKNNWHASGMAMQGEHEVDLTTYNGQRENWLRANEGNPPPDALEPAFRESAARAKKVVDAEKVAAKAFSDEVAKPLNIKIPSADEARTRIMEQMGIGPCIT
jgi:hypothetical protein